MRVNKLAAALALTMLTSIGVASTSYNYTAKVDNLVGPNPAGFVLGETVTGSLNVDSVTAGGNAGLYDFVGSISVSRGLNPTTVDTLPSVTVQPGASLIEWQASDGQFTEKLDLNGTFTGFAYPDPVDFSLFDSGRISLELGGSDPWLMGAAIQTFTPVPTPEPSSLATLGLGAAALIWKLRQRR